MSVSKLANMQSPKMLKRKYLGMTKQQVLILVGTATVVFGIVFVGLALVLQAPVPSIAPVAPSNDATPRSSDVFLELTVDLSSGNRPILVGRTNLPDGTEIMLSVDNRKFLDVPFGGNDKTIVRNGGFRSVALGPQSGLPEGKYTANATMPLPEVQPSSVRMIIGQHGENLKGSLIRRDDIGVTISVDKEFQIGTRISTRVPTSVAGSKEECDDLKVWAVAASQNILLVNDNVNALLAALGTTDQSTVSQLLRISSQFYNLAIEQGKLKPKTTRLKILNSSIREAISAYGDAAGDLAYGLKGNKPEYITDAQSQLNKLSIDYSALASQFEQIAKQCGFK